MQVIHGFDHLPLLKAPVVTVGSYDGVHAGHRELLGHVVRLAKEQGGESVVVTFAPHPRTVLGNRGEPVQLLNTLDEKALLLAELGIDYLVVAPFTQGFSRMPAVDFVRECLAGKLGVRTLVVGYNHRFGHRHEGEFAHLVNLQRELGFLVYEIPKQEVGEDKVSSTVIRNLIAAGDLEQAARLLGHPYIAILHADTEGGLYTGDPHKLLPPPGDYPVRVRQIREDATSDVVAGERECVLRVGPAGQPTLDPPVAKGTEKIWVTF